MGTPAQLWAAIISATFENHHHISLPSKAKKGKEIILLFFFKIILDYVS